jgi:hypothetical protein
MQPSDSEALLATGAIFRLRLNLGRQGEMSGSEKDRLAALVIDQHYALQQALAGSRKRYPTREFRAFAAVMRQYVDATGKDDCYTGMSCAPSTGWSSTCKANERGFRTTSCSKLKGWNVCSSSVTIRTSTAVNLLVCDLPAGTSTVPSLLWLARS